ncbi:MAG: cobalamin-dependent protein [Chloroflexi bacterium]|nr:cobalamin-dependent protein [Chloroflexota bacterium]
MSRAISTLLLSSTICSKVKPEVAVFGSPEQHILCIVDDNQVLLCSPQGHLLAHPFVIELVEEFGISFEEHILSTAGDCLTTPLTELLKARLTLPSVLLVSLFHPEMYPAVRLTLGISYLASYLRLHHLANVELMDCQLGLSVDEVLKYVRQFKPGILGVSVNFGQFDLMEQLLNGIYGPKAEGKPPIVILGNILPAMCYREILEAYPEVVICRKEGELSLASLIKCGRDRSRWSQVPGIYYLSKQGQLVSTPPSYLPLEHLPTPALDTVAEVFARDGVLTAEFSRGCQYNQCSFCPRSHKGSTWRTLPVKSMIQQWEVFAKVFHYFQRTPHVFLADEDFVGKEDGEATIQRITDFLDGAKERGLRITFDASCRADQIFRHDRDEAWHVSRGKLFKRCLDGGLSRLFLGVESGANTQLMRYNKGSTVEEMVSAIRYLSLLGMKLRFGFIFFDPLMSVQDLIENIEFLGRKDVLLPTAHGTSVEDIYQFVSSIHQRVIQQVPGQAVYEDVSYMVSPLEVLAKSRYLFELRQQAPELVSRRVDVSFARYRTAYSIPEIGSICLACQYWVNYCFPIVYALKGLQKISQGEERDILHQAITGHRYLGYLLIRSLAQAFSLIDDTTLKRWEGMHANMNGHEELSVTARGLVRAGRMDEAIIRILTWYEEQIQPLMEVVNEHTDVLSPSKRQAWCNAYDKWMASSLVETHALRMS